MTKKLLLLVTFMGSAFSAFSQGSLPNGNFESWTSAVYDYPMYYPQTSNPQSFFRCDSPFNVTKSTDAYSGSFSLKMETVVNMDTCFGFIANTNVMGGGGPAAWTGGMPFNQKPTGIRGHYKYNVPSGDSAGIIISCRAGGSTVGFYAYTFGGVHTSYSLFNFTFVPALTVTPDSIIIAIVSSNPFSNSAMAGSTLFIDSLSFTGVTAQPAEMNGDFESWQTQLIENPDSWPLNTNDGRGVYKTTDRVGGNFALELQTFAGDNNGVPKAQAGYISTSYWDESCSCQKGGYPFTNMVDTLAFFYKYVPTNLNDSAGVYLTFKNGGSAFAYSGVNLHASPSYQYMELPINLFSTPDSVFVTAVSSAWGDTALSFVGASLKLDEMHFKSQPLSTGILNSSHSDEVHFYPNPFRTFGTIVLNPSINTTGLEINLYDVSGRVVKTIKTEEHKIFIDRTDLKSGIYFYELKNCCGIIKKDKIIIE
jgi:hypothetical protein